MMRIAVCGTQCIGKTTFVNDFLNTWSMYKKGQKTYRKMIDSGLVHSQQGTEDSQRAILNAIIDDIQQCTDEFVIYDRCPLDNLIYTLWLNTRELVSDEFVRETISIVRESLSYFDMVFFLPITKHSPVLIENNGVRDIDVDYRNEIDVLFKTLMAAYTKGSKVYFPIDTDEGCPALIEIYGNKEERIALAKMYITETGKCYGEEDSLLNVPMDDAGKELAREVYGI